MNGEQLHYFELVYREGSFSSAAKRAHMTPQGLSKAIHTLEKELGVVLFDADEETGKPVATAYGQELYEFAVVYGSNLRILNQSFDRIRGDEKRVLRLGCSLGVLGAFGTDMLRDFEALHPNIEVQYWENEDRQCEAFLFEGRYDLALIVGDRPSSGCEGVQLYESPFYFWMLRTDPLARVAETRPLEITDLAGRNIAIPGRGFSCFDYLKRRAAAAQVELGDVVEVNEVFHIYNYAAGGQGLAFSNGTLVSVPVTELNRYVVAHPVPSLRWKFFLEHENGHALDEAELLFWNWCITRSSALPLNDLRVG